MITLTKEDGPADLDGVTHLSIGVSWDPTAGSSGGVMGVLRRKTGTDLDLIAIALQGMDPVRLAGLDSLDPMGNGSLVHSGDNQTGRGEGDDETLTVEFARIPPNITSIVFIAAAFKKGSSFQKARNISFKVYDATGGTTQQVADIWPSLLTQDNGCAVAKAVRVDGNWKLEVINVTGKIKQGDEHALMRFAVSK
ncbi:MULTISPECIES: TerD family protein [Streptomyces]|jgi:stress response protein SCP2|uniref:TerD family protein n=1 Tax=Streptomyces mirabilis TaxID=68239 RepID=A0ABU3UTY9_9ACTN|nr:MULTISPECIES: TerD family protein [Streptomyces]KPI11337.1 stress protein [Actinobacteria bacterium OK006]MCX4424224.1 TerD family protein [Streptomyces mirabilis]MCX4608773.1 TerD family protein [Streptomyces mirabilis]MCX5349224.1 TerD family protein [Streptomyces mirabilis]MDU8997396.1 TerD family protein [Streptomyces mirabilis]